MGFLSSIFGGGHAYEAIKYIKLKTGFDCKNKHINLIELQHEAAKTALQMDPLNTPMVMQRSQLTMVGEFVYLMGIYEATKDEVGMKHIIHSVIIFFNEFESSLPIGTRLKLIGSMPSLMMTDVKKEFGIEFGQ